MKQVLRFDKDGNFIEPVILEDYQDIPGNCTIIIPQERLYKPKWNGTAWVEGLSQEEIDAIKNTPQQLSELEQLKKQQADLTFTLMMAGVI